MTSLATAQRVLADQAVTRMLGTRLVSFGTDGAVVEVDIRPEITNQHGAVHGGIVAYAVDCAVAFAGGAALGPDVVTAGLTIDYLAPARGRTLRAHGSTVRASGRRATCRCEVVAVDADGSETLVAVAQATIITPEKSDKAANAETSAPSGMPGAAASTEVAGIGSAQTAEAAERAARAQEVAGAERTARTARRRLRAGRKQTPTVQEILRARRHSGDNDDGATVALVIEGGGMRGIVSAAMAAVIEQEGILPSVDLIVGTSAGAVNAAALAVGAAGRMAESYAEVFASPDFIDVRRIARGRPVIDGARIVSHVDQLFDVGAAAGTAWAAGRLAMVATDVDTGRAEALTDFTDRADLVTSIHASGLLPLLAGDPVALRGRRWLDGGIVQAVPVVTAAALGATHAIVLATRPPGTQPAYGAADVLAERYLRRLNPELAAAYRGRPHRYRETLQQVGEGWAHGLSTVALTPRLSDPLPSRLERDQAALRAARAAATDAARQHLAFLLESGR
ncbi:patatin-like phospholipase family protein [Actinoplanes sp. NPDC024001]|uniref:patatin-like phospholipase family protein n=1 Tax=Actinoplanes sp. NPDC024001 TaxID=3154598 RepID=UPI0033DBF739